MVRDRHLFCVPDRRPVSLGQLGARFARFSTCPVICALLDFPFVSFKFNKQRLRTAYCSPLSAVCHADVNTSVHCYCCCFRGSWGGWGSLSASPGSADSEKCKNYIIIFSKARMYIEPPQLSPSTPPVANAVHHCNTHPMYTWFT